jgi:hypothetical protein
MTNSTTTTATRTPEVTETLGSIPTPVHLRGERTVVLTWRRILAAGGLGLYALGVAFAIGMVTEHIRFDRERTAVLARYDEAVRQWHQFLMEAEGRAEADGPRNGVAP